MLIGMDANVTYTVEQNGEPITETVLLRQRHVCVSVAFPPTEHSQSTSFRVRIPTQSGVRRPRRDAARRMRSRFARRSRDT
jgi:hypothetical protein